MEISGYGDQVKINAVGDITVSNYQPNVTDISPQQLDSQQTVLEIDQAKYFAFSIDNVDNVQTKPKLMDEAMRKSAYALADDVDQHIADFWSQAVTTVSTTEVTQANALEWLADTAQELSDRSVPSQGRWMVIPPWYHSFLILNGILEARTIDANEMYSNGYVGRAFGFDIYVSNNLTTGSENVNKSNRGLAGTSRAISFADQIVQTEAYRPESAFSDAVKGLHVYGAKTIDPNALISVDLNSSN